MPEVSKSFASRFKKIRLDQGLSQTQYSEALLLSVPSVSRLEHGQATPDLDLILRIVKKYSCDLVWLVTGEGRAEGNIGEATKRQIITLLKRDSIFRAEVLKELGLRPSAEVVRNSSIHNLLQSQRADWQEIVECLTRMIEGTSGAEREEAERKMTNFQNGVAYLDVLLEVGR